MKGGANAYYIISTIPSFILGPLHFFSWTKEIVPILFPLSLVVSVGASPKERFQDQLAQQPTHVGFRISEPWKLRISEPNEALPVLSYTGLSGSLILSSQSHPWCWAHWNYSWWLRGQNQNPSVGDYYRGTPLGLHLKRHFLRQMRRIHKGENSSHWGLGERLESHSSTLVLSDTQVVFKVLYSIRDMMIVTF